MHDSGCAASPSRSASRSGSASWRDRRLMRISVAVAPTTMPTWPGRWRPYGDARGDRYPVTTSATLRLALPVLGYAVLSGALLLAAPLGLVRHFVPDVGRG